ncbi:MAG: hypothetical protein ABI851_08555 [Saprospiraceae bacterium]
MIYLSRPLILLVFLIGTAQAQKIKYVSSRSDYKLSEWLLYDSTETEIGTLNFAGLARDAFSTWNFRLGESSGFIKLRWKENKNEWDMRFDNELLSFKPTWPNQFDQWTINQDGHNFTFKILQTTSGIKAVLQNTSDQEILNFDDDFDFDPRDWTIHSFDQYNDAQAVCGTFILANYLEVLRRR